jgi:phage terminase large subunit
LDGSSVKANREGFVEIIPTRYLPTEEELIADAFASMLDQSLALTQWVGRYRPLPRHKLLLHLYDQAGTPPEERDPPEAPDPAWSPNSVQVILVYGPTRSGKTNSVLCKALQDMSEIPGLTILAARHTYDEINDTIFGDAIAFCSRYGIANERPQIDPPELPLPNGSKMMLRSVKRDEKPGQDKASSLQGMEFGAAILEEADRIPEWYLDTVVTRLSQSGLRRPWIIILCNPPSKNHWIFKRFFVPDPKTGRIPSNHHAIRYPLEENAHNLRPGYVEDLQRELAVSPSRYQRFFEGRFTPPVTGRALFKRYWNSDVHIKPVGDPKKPEKGGLVPLNGVPLWIGLDFGFVHPAVVIAQEDPTSGQSRVLWEYMGNEQLLGDFIEDVKRRVFRKFGGGWDMRWFVDPHGRARNSQTGRSEIQFLQDHGMHPVWKDVNVGPGLSVIADLFITYAHELIPPQPMLVISEECYDLIDGFSFGYTQDPRRHVDGADDELTPYKDGYFEHCLSGSTRVRTLQGWKPIRDLVGQSFWTLAYSHVERRIVPARAEGCRLTRLLAEVWELEHDGGRIRATPEHLFMLRDGSWRQLQHLVAGDELMPLYEVAKDSGHRSVKLNDGSIVYEHQYVYSRLRGYLRDGMVVHHVDGDGGNNDPDNLEQITKRAHYDHHKAERDRQRQEYGVSRIMTPPTHGWASESREKVSKWARQYYEDHKIAKSCECCGDAYFGLPRAKYCSQRCRERVAGARRRDRADREFASASNRGPWRKDNHKVIAVRFWGLENVYNLEVPMYHNFPAEGVMVHNCMDALRYIVINNRYTKRSRRGNVRTQAGTKHGRWHDEEKWDGYKERLYGLEAFTADGGERQRAAYYGFGDRDE